MVEDLEKGALRGCKEVFDEVVAVEGKRWLHWKEEQKLGGGAHQVQSGWSKTAGATDL
ncbi:hypothetical protein BY996DRAFT_6519167 [Phakopsora pachyrhizi]|nr:hypothetical protein BY996DRAFT_6519167 [Phakopsora pachyrhizi]